jgi:uncharacterized Zn-finger protein
MLTHDPQRSHRCKLCGKRFALSQYLKDHMNVHTGDRPYKCKYANCNMAFSQAGKLSAHHREHQETHWKPKKREEKTRHKINAKKKEPSDCDASRQVHTIMGEF